MTQFSEIVIDSGNHHIYRGMQRVRLPIAEFAVVHLLWKSGRRPIRQEALYSALYQLRPECDQPRSNAVVSLISQARGKLARIGITIIRSPGEGYRLALFEPWGVPAIRKVAA